MISVKGYDYFYGTPEHKYWVVCDDDTVGYKDTGVVFTSDSKELCDEVCRRGNAELKSVLDLSYEVVRGHYKVEDNGLDT